MEKRLGEWAAMVEMATNCCGFFSLAQGVMIVAGLDLVRRRARSHLCVRALPAGRADERAAGRAQVQGMLTVFLGLCVLTAPEQFKGHPLAHHFLYNETTVLAVIVMSIIGAVTVHFSMCAIKGVRQLDAKLLWFFFLWKAGRWGNSACGHAGVPARRRAGARARGRAGPLACRTDCPCRRLICSPRHPLCRAFFFSLLLFSDVFKTIGTGLQQYFSQMHTNTHACK